MPKLKVLGGKDLVKIFSAYGFREIGQSGSHLKVRRVGLNGKETLTIPIHSEIDRGLLKKIFNQSSAYIPESELRPRFYTK